MKVRVISKNGTLLSEEEVKVVTLPTSNGVVQILPDHQNLITTLNLGEVIIKTPDTEQRVAVGEGFAKMENNDLLILVDQAEMEDHLVKAEIEKAIKAAEERIASPLPASELIQLEKILRYERFKQTLAEGLGK